MNGLWILAAALKWIGIVLLALLLLLLLLVLLVLLSPVKYRVEVKKEGTASGAFGVSWLLGALRCQGAYAPENGLDLHLKVFWLTLLGGEPKAEKEKKEKKEKKRKKRRKAEPVPEEAAQEISQPLGVREKTEPAKPKAELPEQERPPELPKAQKMERRQAKAVRRVKLEEIAEAPPPEQDFPEDDEAFFTGGDEEPEKRIPPVLSAILHMEGKKEILAAMKKLLARLMKGILPGNFFLKGTFGTGDPAATGYLLAAAGILTARFGNDIQVRGEFSKAAAEDVEIRARGRIVPAYLLWAVLAFLLAKPVRRMLWRLWKMRKEW